MTRPRHPINLRLERLLSRLGLAATISFTFAVPLIYGAFTLQAVHQDLAHEVTDTAASLSRLATHRPELWSVETLRIQSILDQPAFSGHPDERLVFDAEGRAVSRTPGTARWPAIEVRRPIFDSGRQVGWVTFRQTVRPILLRTLLVALGSGLLGWLLYLIFRLVPMRALDRAITELSDERRKVAATLSAIPDGVIVSDGEERVLFMNPAAELLLECTTEEAAGRPLAEVYPIRRSPGTLSGTNLDRAELLRPGASPRTLEERFSPLPSDGDTLSGRVTVFRDVSAQLRTEAELQRVRQIESLGVLAGGIAHDFNNFLSAILGNISLADEDLPRQTRASERLQEAMKATERARSLSLRLLTFAKGGEPMRRVTDLAPVVKEAAEFVIHGTGVRLTCSFEPGLWLAEADEGLLSQVIHNLVINAVEAMGGQGMLYLRLENHRVKPGEVSELKPGPYLRVHLQDSGPGIPPAILPRVFEPYFTPKTAGNGLGLTSSFNIMRTHGGCILAESAPGRGATFILYLPATDKPPVAVAPPPPTAPQRRTGAILVMDDDPVLQEVAAAMLDRTGFQAQTCGDGESAIKAYVHARRVGRPFLAVIMDLTIPGGLGGREAAARILALDPEARLIVSSGYSVDPVLARPRDFGFRAVLPKPYGLAELARVLDEVLG